jgi:hypothetical protein
VKKQLKEAHMKFNIFQTRDSEIRRELTFDGSESWEPTMASKYKKVAVIKDCVLNEVFHIGNGYGDQTKIQRIGDMYSLSVGDLVECVDTGDMLMVDPEGWTCVSYYGLEA